LQLLVAVAQAPCLWQSKKQQQQKQHKAASSSTKKWSPHTVKSLHVWTLGMKGRTLLLLSTSQSLPNAAAAVDAAAAALLAETVPSVLRKHLTLVLARARVRARESYNKNVRERHI